MTGIGAPLPSCPCDAIARSDDLYDDHVARGALRLLSETSEDYVSKAVLACTRCGAELRFSRDDSFHHPIVEWRKRKPAPPAR